MQPLVLLGDSRTRTVRAYERVDDEEFSVTEAGDIKTEEVAWTLSENFLVSADGKHKRARLAGHISYWFAWENFMGVKSQLYEQ